MSAKRPSPIAPLTASAFVMPPARRLRMRPPRSYFRRTASMPVCELLIGARDTHNYRIGSIRRGDLQSDREPRACKSARDGDRRPTVDVEWGGVAHEAFRERRWRTSTIAK